MLAIECVRKDAKLRWEFAPIRFTHRELWLSHQGTDVWHVKRHSTPKAAKVYDDIYLTRTVSGVSRAELERLWVSDGEKADPKKSDTGPTPNP